MADSNLITSKDIIEKTGISRATLNNYIKLGILPKPIVRRPGPEEKGAKQIGYFPSDVLERILKVKLLKQQGNSMEDIAQIFQDIMGDGSEEYIKEDTEKEEIRPSTEKVPATKAVRRISDSDLHVTITDISSPAYLINHNFEIEWVNKAAEEQIFNQNVRTIINVESRNIFKLLLRDELKSNFKNWMESVAMHLTVLQNRITGSKLRRIYHGINDKEIDLLTELYEQRNVASPESLYHLPATIVKADDSRSSYWVHTMSFREGTFFVYVPTDSINTELLDMLSQRGKIINELLKNRMPSLVSLCVLVADLQDSVKISAELLPAQYFELINELWQAVGPTFEKYKGIYGKHAGDGMLYYFIHKPGVNYLINAVNCALEIREVMKELSSKWRLRKGWNNELFLNTGINEGQEFFGTIHSSNTIEFTALGDTINIAGRLSDLAEDGEIWTTKNLISRLTQEERKLIRFGVHHENQTGKIFIRNSFARICDIIQKNNLHDRHLSSIAGLPITEIKEKVSQNIELQDIGSLKSTD
jgi:class 3 adenylate cyclase/DNA-binding transcriptional MerR regulator